MPAALGWPWLVVGRPQLARRVVWAATLSVLVLQPGAENASDQTVLTQKLNAQIAGSGWPKVYQGGGVGVVVRDPFDGYEQDTSKEVVPASFLHNDIFAGNKLFPSWDQQQGANGLDFDTPPMAYVIGSNLGNVFYDLEHIQDPHWGWGVFYAWDSNSVDARCRWLESSNSYNCPGYSVPWDQPPVPTPANKGAGSYPAGNPQANPSWGGGAGCHFSAPPFGCHDPAPCVFSIDQINRNPINLVQDRDCQCNYKFNDNWEHWVQSLGAVEANLLPEAAMCWVNNIPDLIRLQNALWWQRKVWFTSEGQTTGPTGYWGWNEVPLARSVITNKANWDAVLIKMPVFACGGNGSDDNLKCVTGAAALKLEKKIDHWIANGMLVTGVANVGAHPGSSVVLLREYKDSTNNFQLTFFCQDWISPRQKYAIVFKAADPVTSDPGACYLHSLQAQDGNVTSADLTVVV